MREALGLVVDRLDDLRVAVADVQDRDPGEEVEVLVAVGVPEPSSGSADELDGVADVRRDRVVALEGLELAQGHRV